MHACELCGDDEGGGGGVGFGGEELRVIVGDEDSDEEDGEDEEEEDSVESFFDCCRYGFAWVGGFACCDSDEFGALVGESRLD